MQATKRPAATENNPGPAKRQKFMSSNNEGVLSVDTNIQVPQQVSLAPPIDHQYAASSSSCETFARAYQQSHDAPIWPEGIYNSNQATEDGAMFTQLWPPLEVAGNGPAQVTNPADTIIPNLSFSTASQPGCGLSIETSTHMLGQVPFLSTGASYRDSGVGVFPVHTYS